MDFFATNLTKILGGTCRIWQVELNLEFPKSLGDLEVVRLQGFSLRSEVETCVKIAYKK